MARTLLQIINAAQSELGFPQAATVISNTDVTTAQMLGLVQSEVEELNKRHSWTFLQNEYNLIFQPFSTKTGNLTINSNTITGMSSTSGLTANYFSISADGIPQAARIQSVDSSTQITMTMYSTASVTGATITFGQDTYAEPSDFSRFIGDTWYDRSNRWCLLGPDSPQLDEWHRSGIVGVGPRRHFRQLGFQANSYRLWPPPFELTTPLQIVFEYISSYNVFTAGSRASPAIFWSQDTDTPILDDRAIIMGLKWRFMRAKGLNYAGLRDDYNDYVDRQIARDGGSKTLSLVPSALSLYIGANNVQDANFPGPTDSNMS